MSGFLFEKSVMSVQFIQMCFQELSSTTYFCLSVILVFECNSAKKSICPTQAIIATYVLKLFFIASKVVCRVTANNSTRTSQSPTKRKVEQHSSGQFVKWKDFHPKVGLF